MNRRAFRTLVGAGVLLLAAGGCTDITTEPKSSVTGANIFRDTGSYRAFLAKLYAGIAASGQQGPAGAGDIEGIDEGFSQYIRLLWQMQELPTDEAVIAWQDAGLPELNSQLWSSSNPFLTSMYYRIYFQVAMANEFLRETTEAKLAERGVSPQLRAEVEQYRAEARFLRALSYWHGIDLFGNIPLVKETDALGATAPAQSTRAQLYQYVVDELTAIRATLPTGGQGQYGRADRGAVDMLLAKLYLNAEVYTGTAQWSQARAAAEAVIGSGGFQLDDRYQDIFLADNHNSPEIVFAITQDGRNTRSWGGMTFLIHAAVGGGMDAAAFGIDGGWWGLRARPELVRLFPGGPGGPDRRALFHTGGQSIELGSTSDFSNGYPATKYRNITSGGQVGSHLTHPDTDYPMFRLADAYLMYAEAVVRGGGGSRAQALAYVNQLRQRAYGDASGNITDAQLTLDFILDERARELFWEGHRRTDLIRFNRFTNAGVWAWKGGVRQGRTTEPFRNLYPLPASELLANPNLKQNQGY